MAEQQKGLLQAFLENFAGYLSGVLQRAAQSRAAHAQMQGQELQRTPEYSSESGLTPKEEIDRIAVPNQKSASLYSTEEILKGRAIDFARGAMVQVENQVADDRYKDLENKMGMRPGIDGAGSPMKSGPA